jgi:hypothetical protein
MKDPLPSRGTTAQGVAEEPASVARPETRSASIAVSLLPAKLSEAERPIFSEIPTPAVPKPSKKAKIKSKQKFDASKMGDFPIPMHCDDF